MFIENKTSEGLDEKQAKFGWFENYELKKESCEGKTGFRTSSIARNSIAHARKRMRLLVHLRLLILQSLYHFDDDDEEESCGYKTRF